MEQREKINTKEILRASQMGMWCVEMEEGKPPRFYADEVMDELLGIDRDITPEERFVFHRLRIHPEDMQLFQGIRISLQRQGRKSFIVIFIRYPERGLYVAVVRETHR